MRIVIDLQACQSGSKFRGIGRNAMSLGKAMSRFLLERGHEVVCVFSNAFPAEKKQARSALESLVSGLKFASFDIVSPCAAGQVVNAWRQYAARLLREHALACLEPDFVHVPTLLADGWGDDAVASVGNIGVHVPTALTQHDLIPLAMEDIYLPPGVFRDYYMEKLENVRRADLLLAVSNYSREEALRWLGFDEDAAVAISSAVDEDFSDPTRHAPNISATMEKYGIQPAFVLYVPGGFDARKNIDRLFEAYSLLPPEAQKKHQLVIASQVDDGLREGLTAKACAFGIDAGRLVLTGYVSDDDLADLYRACHLCVFPSLHEGFGLPILEAMSCGAPVIASNRTAIPEAVGLDEALFDPASPAKIAEKMLSALTDEGFRNRLKAHAAVQPKKFSWARSAEKAVEAIEKTHARLLASGWRRPAARDLPSAQALLERLSGMKLAASPDAADLAAFHECHASNAKGRLE